MPNRPTRIKFMCTVVLRVSNAVAIYIQLFTEMLLQQQQFTKVLPFTCMALPILFKK